MVDERAIQKFALHVPTYYGGVSEELTKEYELPEFGSPRVPVLIHSADGIRIVLGPNEFLDFDKPDIQIERRPKGWAVFLHPSAGDPCGYVYFHDDGRSFLLPEIGTGAIEVLERGDVPPEIDFVDGPVADICVEAPQSSAAKRSMEADPEQKFCSRCGQTVEYSGDWYGDLCPTCADETDVD